MWGEGYLVRAAGEQNAQGPLSRVPEGRAGSQVPGALFKPTRRLQGRATWLRGAANKCATKSPSPEVPEGRAGPQVLGGTF